MATKPNIPVTRKEMYLDVMTGGSSTLPEPVTIEEKYLAKIAGMTVDLPAPVPLKHKFLAKIAGMQVDVPTYTTGLPRIYAYLAKAAGQDVEVPQPITREEMYWFDYVSGQPTPSEREYTGAVPVTFTADGTPLLDYLINGNTVQSSTPTPDSPVMPQGCGNKTANLFNETYPNIDSSLHYSAIYVGDGQFTMSTTCPRNQSGACLFFLAGNVSSGASTESNGVWGYSGTYGTMTRTQTAVNGYVTVAYRSLTELNPVNEDTMVNSGSTAQSYEPYGYKLDISCGDTVTPIYLGEVQSTRKIKKLVLTGKESWQLWDRNYYSSVIDRKGAINTIVCSHFINSSSNGISYNRNVLSGLKIAAAVVPFVTSVSELTTYLAAQYAVGTPVTVWYVLATPETGIVNEPIRKIGDYADSINMEQAGVEIPTVNGSNTLDVDTTVKPSEVYIKYKGYPVAGSQTSLQSSAYAPAEVSSQSESIDDINSSLLGKDEET